MTDETRAAKIRAQAYDYVRRFGTASADDLEAARAIAMGAIEMYGDLNEAEMKDAEERGIWNDHVAVQAALAAIRMMREELMPLIDPPRITEGLKR